MRERQRETLPQYSSHNHPYLTLEDWNFSGNRANSPQVRRILIATTTTTTTPTTPPIREFHFLLSSSSLHSGLCSSRMTLAVLRGLVFRNPKYCPRRAEHHAVAQRPTTNNPTQRSPTPSCPLVRARYSMQQLTARTTAT